MEPEDCAPEKYPSAGGAFSEGRRPRRSDITHGRRIELQNFARKIAVQVLEETKQHERCLLRQMVEQLMPGED